MDIILQWGVDLILWIQSFRTPASDEFFRQITKLGGRYYVFLLPLIVWIPNFRFAVRTSCLFLISFFINFGFKDALSQPRPFNLEPNIGPDREYGYGLPSGHAQHSAVLWIKLALGVAKHWFWVFALSVAFLIGFSRIYLGVHFPHDVIGGWILAGALIWAYLKWGDEIADWLNQQSVAQVSGCATLFSAFIVASFYLFFEDKTLIGLAGIILSLGLGASISIKTMGYTGKGTLWQRLLRYPLGMVVMLVYMKLAGGLFPEEHNLQYFITMYLVNLVAGLWVFLGAPALFTLCRLSEREEKEVTPDQGAVVSS